MGIVIRDWSKHFEHDRSKQWKRLHWVPIPNKQGTGYRMIMHQKNGGLMFGCWVALIQAASQSEVRGDLSKYSDEQLSILTLFDISVIKRTVKYLSEALDWIIVTDNLDKCVNEMSECVSTLHNITEDNITEDNIDISSENLEVANILKTRILERRQQKIDDNTINKWANTVRLMIERDNRGIEDISKLIHEVHNIEPSPSGFTWRDQILSMDKLRQKWNEGKIYVGMSDSTGKPKMGFEKGNEGKYDRKSVKINL